MKIEGPALEILTRRLTETPEVFLAEPRIGPHGKVHVAAVIGDLITMLGGNPNSDDLIPFQGCDVRQDRNRLSITLLICWLLEDEWFRTQRIPTTDLLKLFREGSAQLGAQVAARKFIDDPERREELARFTLARLGYRPSGETHAQAEDRLTSLSSAERARVLQASRAAEQRSRAIREALARKAAEESADKFTRE